MHHRSVVPRGRLTFFLSARGFHVCDGSTVTPIGDEKVDRTFLAAVQNGRFGRMSAAVDPVRKLVMWTLPEENPDEWFIYSWTLGRWAKVVSPARLLFSMRQRAATLGEDLNPQPDDNLLAGGLPFGDPTFAGATPFVGVFDGSNGLGTLTGPPMAAKLGSGPVTLGGAREARIRAVRPTIDAATGLTLSMAAERRHGDAPTVTTWTDLRGSGDMPVRDVARIVTPTLEVAAGTSWTFAQGLEIEFERGAGR